MITFITSAISIGIVFLYGCVGEILTEKAGHLNLGIPGIMCVGAAGGCYGVSLYINSLADPYAASWIVLVVLSIGFSVLFSLIMGLIYSFLTVSLRCNQNISGLALTTFGVGFSQFFMGNYVDRTYFAAAGKI